MEIIEDNSPQRPLVSVVTPVCNTARFLPECLDSLCSQTLKNIEFICINDGSSDNSLDILKQYQARDSRIRIVNKTNSGYGATMNLGFSLARGEYVGIVESDDFIERTMFKKLYKYASHHNCDLVKCNYFEHSDTQDVEQRPFDAFKYNHVFDPREEKWVLCILPIIWAALYRRELIIDNHVKFNETPGASFQDTSFVFQVWACARRAALLPKPLIHYRVDNTGSSVKSSKKVFSVCDEYALSLDFLKRDPARYEAFAPILNVMKIGTYKWNYDRIDLESKHAFAQRMAEEYRAADTAGVLDKTMFGKEDWELIQALMNDPETVVASHPDTFF